MSSKAYKIICVDNFNRDCQPEIEVNTVGYLPEEKAQKIADLINELVATDTGPHYWRVVPADYVCCRGMIDCV